MIAIVDVGPDDDAHPMAECTYKVRINEQVMTTLRHWRSDGVATSGREQSGREAEANGCGSLISGKILMRMSSAKRGGRVAGAGLVAGSSMTRRHRRQSVPAKQTQK